MTASRFAGWPPFDKPPQVDAVELRSERAIDGTSVLVPTKVYNYTQAELEAAQRSALPLEPVTRPDPFPCIYCDGRRFISPLVRCAACDGLGVELAAHAIVRELESLTRRWMHPEFGGDVVDDVRGVIEQCGGAGLVAARERIALDVWNGGRHG